MPFTRTESDPPLAILTLDRPEVLNAWHRPMREEVVEALTAFEADEKVRAVIVTGAGERAFCAGQDLNEARDFGADDTGAWLEEWRRLYDRVRSMSKPVIAALNGVAAGSAFQFCLFCDVRIGHGGARMGQPEIDAGIASITGPWIMREVMGLSRTVEMTLSGRLIRGEEALAIGLLHHLAKQRDVMGRAREVAAALAAKPPLAMRLDKAWLREMTQPGFERTFAAAARYHALAYAGGEPLAHTSAFLDRRR